jgi:hypothetical protein
VGGVCLTSSDNQAAGRMLGRFYNDPRCAPRVEADPREPFLVIPMTGELAPPTYWVC